MAQKKKTKKQSSPPKAVPQKAQAPVAGQSHKKAERATARAASAKKKQQHQSYAIWGVLGLVFAAVVAFSLLSGGSSLTGVALAEEWDLPAMGPNAEPDARVRLADFAGKPTIVNFFASWCIECGRELPYFATISDELRDDVNFVGIASAENGNPMFMPEKHGVDWWPLARDIGGNAGNDLAVNLGMRPGSMPLTVFYDTAGKVLRVNPGAMSEAGLRANIAEFYPEVDF